MENISLPAKVDIQSNMDNPNEATIIIEPLYPGYGVTVGNALRRVLLSSMSGAAPTAIKIKGATHEFSTIPHVKEDIVNIILAFKQLRIKVFEAGEIPLTLRVTGKKKVLAKDIKTPSSVEVASKDLYLFTTTNDKADIEMTIWVTQGRGYEPVESKDKDKYEVGVIALDSIFTPVLNVSYRVENVRVGQRTDYDKLILGVKTDGIISPKEALREASKILVEQFQFLTGEKKETESGLESEELTEGALAKDLTEIVPEKILIEPENKTEIQPQTGIVEESKTEEKEKPKRGRPKKKK